MSVVPFTLPPAFPLVGLGVVSTLFLNIYQQLLVSRARKEAKVFPPTLYVSDVQAKDNALYRKYNCTQRAHQNTLENIPYIYASLAYLGMFHPKLATASTLLWVIGRIGYTNGYATGEAKSRNNLLTSVAYIGLLGLFGGNLYTAFTQAYQILA